MHEDLLVLIDPILLSDLLLLTTYDLLLDKLVFNLGPISDLLVLLSALQVVVFDLLSLNLVLLVVDELLLDKDSVRCVSKVGTVTKLADTIFTLDSSLADTLPFRVGDLILLLKISDLALAPLAADFMSLFSTLLVDLLIVLGIVLGLTLLVLSVLMVKVLLLDKLSSGSGCLGCNDGLVTCFPANTLDLLRVEETKLEGAVADGFDVDADVSTEDRLVRASFNKGDLFVGTWL